MSYPHVKKHDDNRSRTKLRMFKLILVCFLLLILYRPMVAVTGAKAGLMLWFETVLPNLLPFMILSGLIVRLKITRPIGKLLYPILHILLPISKNGCYAVFIGFLSGLPIGAKTSADLYIDGQISKDEAQFLTNMCNNPSPIFQLGYIAVTSLALPSFGLTLCIIIYTSSILAAMLCYHVPCNAKSIPQKNAFLHQRNTEKEEEKAASEFQKQQVHFSISLLDETILNAFEIVTKIGGYLILFSVFAAIIASLSGLTPFISTLFTALLEITLGIHRISLLAVSQKIKIVLICFLTAFGGLSGLAQTKSVISKSGLSIQQYLYAKLLSAIIACILGFTYVSFFL